MTKYPLIEAMGLKIIYNYDSDDDVYFIEADDLEKALQAAPVIHSGNPPESWIALKNNSTIQPLTLDGREVLEARVVCIKPLKKKTKAEAAIEFLEEWAIYINKGTESIELKCFERGLKKILEMPE